MADKNLDEQGNLRPGVEFKDPYFGHKIEVLESPRVGPWNELEQRVRRTSERGSVEVGITVDTLLRWYRLVEVI